MDELLIKYLLGEATAAEKQRVDEWRAVSPENTRRFDQFKKVWALGRKTAVPGKTDTAAALERFRRRSTTVPPRRPVYWMAAAVLAGLFVLGAAIRAVIQTPKAPMVTTAQPAHASTETTLVLKTTPAPAEASPTEPPPAEAHAGTPGWQTMEGIGQLTTDTLSDGSVVVLQQHARISWRPAGSKEPRQVKLSGDAFFTVTADPDRPFIVETNTLIVKVLGTSFMIRNRKDSTVVLVRTGAVRVLNTKDSIILRAGEKVVAAPGDERLTAILDREAIDNKQVMRLLIGELVDKKIIPHRDSLGWLALDSVRFVIDGRDMPADLRARFQSKYLQQDAMGYYYGKVKVHGHGYFYEKQMLYQP